MAHAQPAFDHIITDADIAEAKARIEGYRARRLAAYAACPVGEPDADDFITEERATAAKARLLARKKQLRRAA
jgi:hypothetical protein